MRRVARRVLRNAPRARGFEVPPFLRSLCMEFPRFRVPSLLRIACASKQCVFCLTSNAARSMMRTWSITYRPTERGCVKSEGHFELGLDDHGGDLNGETRRKRSDTLVRTLCEQCG